MVGLRRICVLNPYISLCIVLETCMNTHSNSYALTFCCTVGKFDAVWDLNIWVFMQCRLVNCYFRSKRLDPQMCIVCRFISEKWRAPVSKHLPARRTAVDKNIWGQCHSECGRTLIFSLAWTVQWRLERIYLQTFSQITWHVKCSTIYLFEGRSLCLGFFHWVPSCSLGVTNFTLIFQCMWSDILFTSLTHQWKNRGYKVCLYMSQGFCSIPKLVIDRNEFFTKYKLKIITLMLSAQNYHITLRFVVVK